MDEERPQAQVIARVFYANAAETKLITVPKKCHIKVGDYVELRRIPTQYDFNIDVV